MKEQGFTQAQIADATNSSQATVSGWLNGSIPRGDALYKLSKVLRIRMEYLLMGEENTALILNEDRQPHLSSEIRRLVKQLVDVTKALEKEIEKY